MPVRKTPKFPFSWVEGDCYPALTCEYEGKDLSAYLSVRLHLSRPDDSVLVKDATEIDFSLGQFRFDWTATDLQAGVNQEAEIQFEDASGKMQTSPLFLIDVRSDLA